MDITEERRGAVLQLEINRPAVRNALSPEAMRELCAAFERAGADPTARVIVLCGAGGKAFSSGADLGGGAAGVFADPRSFTAHEERGGLAELLRAMHACPKPIVGKVQGYCIAGGVGLALACDLLIAGESATFATPELSRGLFPMVIFAEIVRNVGRKQAMELVLLGERFDAMRAAAIGLVNRVVPDTELDAAVAAIAERLASFSPAVLGLGKRACYQAAELAFEPALEFLRGQLTVNLLMDDAAEGLAAFREKRPPKYRGR
jgi:enoyl-CoA hydratase/carnithine racemase